MAEVISKRSIVYDITFETGKAEKGAQDIGKAMDKTEKDINDATKAVTNFADKTLSAAARLRQIKAELNNFRGTEAQFQKLSLEAAKLTDQIQKTNQRIAVLASSTRNIQALASAFSGLTGVFTAVQGAQALFGKESENVQRALVKLQGSLALLQGVQAAVGTITEQSAAKTVIMANAQKLYTFVTNAATFATKAFRAALIATVGGAVLVGIGLLIANWDKLKIAISGASNESERFAKAEIRRLDFQIKKAEILKQNTDSLREAQLNAQLELANAQKDEEKQIELLQQKELLRLEITNRKAKENFEEKKRIKQLEIELAEDGSKKELDLQIELIDIERSIQTSGDKITQEELFLILQVAEEKKRKLRMDYLIKQRQDIEDILFDPKLWEKERDAILNEFQELSDKLGDETITPAGIINTGLDEYGKQLLLTKTQSATVAEALKDDYETILSAGATTFSTLAGLAKDGSGLQIALAQISILADYAAAIASAIKGATASGAATGPAAIATTPGFIATLVATTVGAFAASFTNLQKAKALQSGASSNTATAFAEGEVDIHRSGETRGKDSIPAIIMPGESVITTEKTAKYKPFLEAIHNGNLEELIRVNYVEPALAVKTLEGNDSRSIPDYSEKLYRQILVANEGNTIHKRSARILASIDRKLTPKQKRHPH